MNKLTVINWVMLRLFKRYVRLHRWFPNDNLITWTESNNKIITIQDILYRHLEVKGFSGLNVIQIGAHNGSDNNEISLIAITQLPESKLVLIEPNPAVFRELKDNYIDSPNVKCLNIAISDDNESRDFYVVNNDPSLPTWANQLSSFDNDQILNAAKDIPNVDISKFICKIKVHCNTFRWTVENHLDGHVDVVLIDVEGYDAQIVKSIPLSELKPTIIFFEHKHLHSSDFVNTINFLKDFGYSFTYYEFDTLAYIPQI